MLGSCEIRADVEVCRYAVSRGIAAVAVGVAMTGVGGAVVSVRADPGVLCREDDRRCSRAPPDLEPFLDPVGGMVAWSHGQRGVGSPHLRMEKGDIRAQRCTGDSFESVFLVGPHLCFITPSNAA